MADKDGRNTPGTGDPTDGQRSRSNSDAKSKLQARAAEIANTMKPEAVAKREADKTARQVAELEKYGKQGNVENPYFKPQITKGVTSGGRTRRRKKSKKTHKKRHSRRR